MSYSKINCNSPLIKTEISKCTQIVHEFQQNHLTVDGNQWLDQKIAKDLNERCDHAENCLQMLGSCSIFEDDDILWLADFCDSYQFLTSRTFYQCALKIDKNYKEQCVQNYLVNSPYFMLSPSNRCSTLKSDGSCLKSVINSTCSRGNSDEFQNLLNRQMIRLKC